MQSAWTACPRISQPEAARIRLIAFFLGNRNRTPIVRDVDTYSAMSAHITGSPRVRASETERKRGNEKRETRGNEGQHQITPFGLSVRPLPRHSFDMGRSPRTPPEYIGARRCSFRAPSRRRSAPSSLLDSAGIDTVGQALYSFPMSAEPDEGPYQRDCRKGRIRFHVPSEPATVVASASRKEVRYTARRVWSCLPSR